MLRQVKRWARRAMQNQVGRLAYEVKDAHLTYLDHQALVELYQTVRRIERDGIVGKLVEAGTALGGSAVMLVSAKDPARPLELYDTFEMIPPPSPEDGADIHQRYTEIVSGKSNGIGGETYYGYRGDLREEVATTLRRFGYDPDMHTTRMIKGLYEHTLYPEGSVALAHIDCDWYASVRCCLERLWPLLPPGGTLIIDDYHAWSGCRKATDEFVAAHAGAIEVKQFARPHLIKLG